MALIDWLEVGRVASLLRLPCSATLALTLLAMSCPTCPTRIHIWALKLKELSCESCDRRKRFLFFSTSFLILFIYINIFTSNSIRYYVRGPVMGEQCCRCLCRCLGSCCCMPRAQHLLFLCFCFAMWTLPIRRTICIAAALPDKL